MGCNSKHTRIVQERLLELLLFAMLGRGCGPSLPVQRIIQLRRLRGRLGAHRGPLSAGVGQDQNGPAEGQGIKKIINADNIGGTCD
jgi:hypothetical protein